MAKGKGGKSEIVVTGRTAIPKGGLTCVGDICYNSSTGKIEVKLNRDSCPPGVVEGVIQGVLKGTEVEFVVPKRKV